MTAFPCEKCGCCCRAVKCSKIGEDGLCTIYGERPIECNVEKLYHAEYKKRYTKEQFYAMNKDVCKILQEHQKWSHS